MVKIIIVVTIIFIVRTFWPTACFDLSEYLALSSYIRPWGIYILHFHGCRIFRSIDVYLKKLLEWNCSVKGDV